jgi:hypothetical protein
LNRTKNEEAETCYKIILKEIKTVEEYNKRERRERKEKRKQDR